MADYLGDFNEIANAQKERAQQQDRDDLSIELSGMEVGRIPRFLSPEARDAIYEAKTGHSRSFFKMSALDWLLLNDREYSQLYEAALDDNREARSKLQSLDERLELAAAQAKRNVDDSIENAVTLPDGRKAHLDKNGVAWTINNERVEETITEGIDWTGRESRESYIAKVERLSTVEQMQNESSGLGLRLGEIGDALHDDETPPTKDELKAYRDEQKSITEQIDILDQKLDSTLSAANPSSEMVNDIEAVKNASIVPVI